MFSSSSFQNTVLEFMVLNSARAISRYISYILWSDPEPSHCCYQNYLMHFCNASFCCKHCVSHLSRLHLSMERNRSFSFILFQLQNTYSEISTKLDSSGQRQGISWVILLAAYVTFLAKFWKSSFSALIAHMCSLSLWSAVSKGLSKVVCAQVGHNSSEQHYSHLL